MFDPVALLAYLKGKATEVGNTIKTALSKVLGLYDASESIIHIDNTVVEARQNFLKLHETGHHDIPTHKKLFRFFQDCEKTLAPEVADQFEREANNFARFALFKGGQFAQDAADCKFEIKTPMKLAKRYGASVYASVREFARTNARACIVYALEPIEFVAGYGARAEVRRIEVSPNYLLQFGMPTDLFITLDHPLGSILPIGRKMTRPTTLILTDLNGNVHECLAEAFDTTYNVFILIYPVKALTKKIFISSVA
ncbi:ImmA/IrrE family metallo-endopeptidase [Xanthobacter versatilis]|uniref:ImmA/IrrE family metallo-endopeptidase n=1 Tax=Xanthobacter autotrophicus (strain ATCC BAA-1158 / Py2) TaxID=78245 RepID=UPI003728FDAD